MNTITIDRALMASQGGATRATRVGLPQAGQLQQPQAIEHQHEVRLPALPRTKISLNLIYNDATERFRLRYHFRAFTQNQNAVPSATSGVIPGFTNRITSVRNVAAWTIDITSQMSHCSYRQRHADIGVEQTFGPLQLDYNAVAGNDHINGGGGDGGVLVNRVTGVGWTLDRTASDLFPLFLQTSGPDRAAPRSIISPGPTPASCRPIPPSRSSATTRPASAFPPRMPIPSAAAVSRWIRRSGGRMLVSAG